MKFQKQNWAKLALELFVVFLGVTSGFLLNNWQIRNQEAKIEQKYLEGFLEDVNSNISELEDAIKKDSIWIIRSNELIQIITAEGLTIDSTTAAISLISNLSTIEINASTYDDIINSGNLNLINSFHLKSHIIKYQNVIAKATLLDEYLKDFFNNFLLPFMVSETNIMTVQFNDPETIKSIKFSNLLGVYYSLVNQRTIVYKEFLDESLALSKELKNSLNK